MGRGSGSKDLRAFAKRMKELGKDVPKIMDEFAAHEGEVLAGMIKERTPVVTGDLRNNFHSYRDNRPAAGKSVTVTVANNLEYASYVEKGHRQTPGRFVPAIGKRLKKGWVQGRFMMRTSVRLYKDNVMDGNISRFVGKKLKEYVDG